MEWCYLRRFGKNIFNFWDILYSYYFEKTSWNFQFECCMAGWKRVGSVDICSAPCCPGYREVVEKPPYLQAVSFCVKGLFHCISRWPGTRNQKPETKNQKPETKNQKPKTRNQKPKTRNQDSKSKNLIPKPITYSSDSFTNLEFKILWISLANFYYNFFFNWQTKENWWKKFYTNFFVMSFFVVAIQNLLIFWLLADAMKWTKKKIQKLTIMKSWWIYGMICILTGREENE